MSRFVIPALRASLPDDMLKSFQRGPLAQHKYLKREPYFVGGKLRWRYWYASDELRKQGMAEHDPAGEHEHHLLANIADIYEHFKAVIRSTAATPTTAIEGIFQKAVDDPKAQRVPQVAMSPAFQAQHVQPFIDAEAKGAPPEASPIVRVHDALEMVPDYLLKLVMGGTKNTKHPGYKGLGPYPGLSALVMNRQEDEGADYANTAGWAHPKTGELHLLGGGFGKHGSDASYSFLDGGDPATAPTPTDFNDAKVHLEKVVWHELGHHVHFTLETEQPDVMDSWRDLSTGPGPKPTAYAHTAWWEDFAESFAGCFALPKVMAMRCPERYDWMRQHVLKSLPERSALLKMSDEELAWWNKKKTTPPGKLLLHLKSNAPARRFGAYYSDKDQFFTVGKGGRTVYLRFGPSEPDQEDGWTQVPSTIDPETGLPVYDAAFGPRFKVQGNLKEMYDERGNPLDDFQAFLYLGQDDPEVQKFVADTMEKYIATLPPNSPQPTEYEAVQWLAAKGGDEAKALETRLLSYKMYTSLGYKRESEKISAKEAHTTEKERKRVEKERAKGGTGYLDRHDWVPVEIPRSEFVQKSGTFKFDNVRPAEYQPWQAREWDPVTKTSRVKTVYDPAAGKAVPVRTATVYEQVNPDGTTFRVTVAEGEPFSIGQTILAPVSVKLPDGRISQDWQPYKLSTEDGEMTVTNLAKKFRIDPEALLRQNHRYMRGQITDPMLAALLNPSGEVIRDQFDLMRLMKLAAEQPTPPTAWVSVRGKTGSIAHFKVSFDGSGPPRVEGRQWAAKLGKDPTDPIRLDQILGKDDELIGVETVRERKAKEVKIKPGGLVWVTVKNHLGDAKRVMARYIEKKSFEEKGKKKSAHVVQVLPGQGTGLPKDRVIVTRVNKSDESQIPGKPEIRRRFVEPMQKDVLLYADEVRVGSGDRDTSGVIKILPPKNGSVTKAQLAAIPGVRIIGLEKARNKKGGAVTEELPDGVELAISPRDLPAFREYLGGFVMDERVSAMMDEQAAIIRERSLQVTGEDWPPADQIVDADGNVNPNGVLRGMVTGAMGMQPGAHRIEALQRVAMNNGRLIAAHFMGTGKTAFSIAAAQMMRNLESRDQPGKPHPNQVKKKVLALVPLNTANNYADEVEVFTGRPATIIGSGSLAGSVRMFRMPKDQGQKKNETREAFIARSLAAWKAAVKTDPTLWNPWADDSQMCVCPYEYFRDNEELMRATEMFDGLVVDEAHNIARENELSRAVERWNPNMNMFLMLTGTPVTNTLDVLPRMASLVSAGKVNLGTKQEFTERYLVGSAVAKGEGAKNPPKTDLNPQRAGELAAIMRPLMHIATTQDVKGKTMPAVLLDENKPAHMIGQQARMYRLSMAKFTPEEKAAIIESGAVGTDESYALDEEGRRKIGVARSIANCLAYKAPDQRENLTYESKTTEEKKGKVIEKTVTRVFSLPTHAMMTTKRPEGWGGKWPTFSEVEKGIVEAGYYNVLSEYYERLFGVTYDSVEGKPISKEILEGVKRGDYVTPSGAPWGTVVNPDYGPEGMICRGTLDPVTGKIEPLRKEIIENGQKRVVEVKPGTRFIRDPNSKAAGLFYHEDDWNFTGRFIDSGEGGGGEGGGEDDPSDPKPASAGKQAPKDPSLSIQRSTKRRKEREMFDLAVTQGNAKSDELEQYIHNALRDDNLGPDQQFILFGNRIGSSFRTMESKLRTMGFQDVNEALGHPEWSTAEDKAMMPRKFFVTYAGKGATLGDRDINSEIFRQKLDQFGHKTGQSMFVFRTLNGGTKKPPKVGEMREGWSRGQRKRIADALAEPTRKTAEGKPAGLEVPMRVTSVEVDGRIEQRYLYESDMKPKDRAEFLRLEKERRGADKARKQAIDGEMRALADRYWSDRIPLSDHYQYVLNNTQIMVATDAANVGLNWPAPKLVMYDSLFSPMDEWQRMTRAARMLDAAVTGPAKKYVEKIDAKLAEMEKQTGLKEYGPESSLQAVQDAIESLPEDERAELLNLEGGGPDQIVEAIFSRRAMDKIAKLRPEVGAHLRQAGAAPDPDRPEIRIRPSAIQESDVTNEIIRKHLTPFEQRVLRGRMYLVDVKRLTTSCDVPEMKSIRIEDPMTGKKTTVQIPTGNWSVEAPTQAERSQLTQGRMKMVPYEKAMKAFQNAQPIKTDYDFLVTPRASVRSFSIMPEEIEREKASRAKRAVTKPKPTKTKKSESYSRFFIPARLARGEA